MPAWVLNAVLSDVSSTPKVLLCGVTVSRGGSYDGVVLLDEWTAAVAAIGCKKIRNTNRQAISWRVATDLFMDSLSASDTVRRAKPNGQSVWRKL
jgi:hypothetical protein